VVVNFGLVFMAGEELRVSSVKDEMSTGKRDADIELINNGFLERHQS
jgi:hypothetical protein